MTLGPWKQDLCPRIVSLGTLCFGWLFSIFVSHLSVAETRQDHQCHLVRVPYDHCSGTKSVFFEHLNLVGTGSRITVVHLELPLWISQIMVPMFFFFFLLERFANTNSLCGIYQMYRDALRLPHVVVSGSWFQEDSLVTRLTLLANMMFLSHYSMRLSN